MDFSSYRPQTSFKSQSEAQFALDSYYAAAQAKVMQQAIKNDIASADAALTHAERDELNNWNAENHNLYNISKNINPEYMLWLKRGSSGTTNPPKYIEDAYSESYEARQARQAWNATREAQVAASQAQLKASYDATLKASGTTHVKNSVKINPAKVVAKTNQTVKVNDVKVVKNESTPTKKVTLQAGSNATAKFNKLPN